MATRTWRQDSSRLHQGGANGWLQHATQESMRAPVLPCSRGLTLFPWSTALDNTTRVRPACPYRGSTLSLTGVATAIAFATTHDMVEFLVGRVCETIRRLKGFRAPPRRTNSVRCMIACVPRQGLVVPKSS